MNQFEKEYNLLKMQQSKSNKFWMITGNGNNPQVRHTSLESANAEADRLAKANPGVDFFVLEAVEKIYVPSGVVKTRL